MWVALLFGNLKPTYESCLRSQPHRSTQQNHTDPNQFTLPPHTKRWPPKKKHTLPGISLRLQWNWAICKSISAFPVGKGCFHEISIATGVENGSKIPQSSYHLASAWTQQILHTHLLREHPPIVEREDPAAIKGWSQLACLDCRTFSLMKWQYVVRTEGNRTHHVRWWFLLHGQCFMHRLHGLS